MLIVNHSTTLYITGRKEFREKSRKPTSLTAQTHSSTAHYSNTGCLAKYKEIEIPPRDGIVAETVLKVTRGDETFDATPPETRVDPEKVIDLLRNMFQNMFLTCFFKSFFCFNIFEIY